MPFISSFSNTGRAKATFPGQPGTPSIDSQSSGQVGISWTAPSFSGGAPLTDYKIEYSSNGGSSWNEWSHSPSLTTSATVTGLADYNTYIFRVSGVNAVGAGTPSSNSANAEQFNSATGGTVTTVSNYNGTGETWKVHQFTSSSTFTMSRQISNSSVLVVGGGGGGNNNIYRGGGGGAGALYYFSSRSLENGSYPVVVGVGGRGRAGSYTYVSDLYGQASTFDGISAPGGGCAGTYASAGRDGACGGGGSEANNNPGGTGSVGGNGAYSAPSGGGTGGGGGGMGGSATTTSGGSGLSNTITGSSVTYCRGGNGGGHPTHPTPPANSGYGGEGGAGQAGYASGAYWPPGDGAAGTVIVSYRVS